MNGSVIVVNNTSEYYVKKDDVTIDKDICIKVDDSSSIKCIKVSNDADEKCIEITAPEAVLIVKPDSDNNGDGEVCKKIEAPEFELTTINNEPPIVFENLELLDMNEFNKYKYDSDLKKFLKHYVKDFDTVQYTIKNFDSNKNYYVFTSSDNINDLGSDMSSYATINTDSGVITLDVKNQLDGYDISVWLWVYEVSNSGGKCWSNCETYVVETMERSKSPRLANYNLILNPFSEKKVKIINYNKDSSYVYDKIYYDNLELSETDIKLSSEYVNVIYDFDEIVDYNLYYELYSIDRYCYKSYKTSLYVDIQSVTGVVYYSVNYFVEGTLYGGGIISEIPTPSILNGYKTISDSGVITFGGGLPQKSYKYVYGYPEKLYQTSANDKLIISILLPKGLHIVEDEVYVARSQFVGNSCTLYSGMFNSSYPTVIVSKTNKLIVCSNTNEANYSEPRPRTECDIVSLIGSYSAISFTVSS